MNQLRKTIKKTTNEGGYKLADGYKTESGKPINEADEREFIVKPDGSKDFGEISQAISKATNGEIQSAPIRLQVGNNNFGYIHLLSKHGKQMNKKGYSVMNYINHILKNFNQIYSQQTDKKPNRFVLYCKDESKGFMPIDLEFEKEQDGYYTIVSAMPHKAKIKGTLLFDGSANPSITTTSDTLLAKTGDKGGAGNNANTHGKNNVPSSTSNISQEQKPSKGKVKKKRTERAGTEGNETVIEGNGGEVSSEHTQETETFQSEPVVKEESPKEEKKHRIFSTQEEAEKELEKALGIRPVKKKAEKKQLKQNQKMNLMVISRRILTLKNLLALIFHKKPKQN